MPKYGSRRTLDTVSDEDMDIGFLGFNNRLRPDQLKRGVLAESLNGRCDLNGEWQPRKGIDLALAPFSASDLTLPFTLYDSLPSVNSYSDSGTTLTIDFSSAHSITDQTVVNLNGLTGGGGDPDPNNNYVATVTDTDSIEVTIPTMTATPTGTLTVTGPDLEDTNVAQVYGALAFYDDSNSLAPYIVLAGNSSARAVHLDTLVATTITYPTDEMVTADCEMVEYFGKVIIFREGGVAMVWDGDLSGSPAFALVANGAYTQPALLSATGFTITNGVATATVTNTLAVGDVVSLADDGSSTLTEDAEFVVASASGSQFTFYVSADDVSNQTDVVFIPKVSAGQGFSHMPSPPFGVVHEGRLAMPFWYTQSGASGSATITDREVRDELILSRIQDHDVYDYIYGQLKVQGDKSDYTVGLHSFNEDKLVVFNRESIYVVSGSLDLPTAQVDLLTNEVGCIARKSILQIGNKLVFLSDNGVYALDFVDLYNLRGNELPLSEAIDPTIQRINKAQAANAEAAYHDNRYYLSVALDNSPINNALLVYNFLNREWTSIDTVDDEDEAWEFANIMVAGSGDSRGLYCCNDNGGIHRLEARVDDRDVFVSSIGGSTKNRIIQGTATTRMYTMGSMGRKKWNGYDIHLESSGDNASDGTLTGLLENIDGTISVGTISSLNGSTLAQGEDVSLRGRLGNQRAYGFQMKLETTQGRPKFRALTVEALDSFRSTIKAE